MNVPFKRLGPSAVYPGVTGVTWMAGLPEVEPGDIIEIRWGVVGTSFDRGKVSTGTVTSVAISEGVGVRGRFKRGEIMLRRGWHEQTVETVIQDESLLLVPDVCEMPFPHTFDLRTDDVGDEAWTLVIRGHDHMAHDVNECTSKWLPQAERYLAAHPEAVAP